MSSFMYMTERAKALHSKVTKDFGDAKIRSQETFGLPVGIRFRIPEKDKLEIHWQEMPNAPIDPDTGEKQLTPSLILQVEGTKSTDENSGIRFYPSTLTKLAFEAKEGGVLTGNIIRAKGTAVSEYIKYHLVKDGMNALAGKLLEVTQMDQVRVRRFGSTVETRMTTIPTIDIVDETVVDETADNTTAKNKRGK